MDSTGTMEVAKRALRVLHVVLWVGPIGIWALPRACPASTANLHLPKHHWQLTSRQSISYVLGLWLKAVNSLRIQYIFCGDTSCLRLFVSYYGHTSLSELFVRCIRSKLVTTGCGVIYCIKLFFLDLNSILYEIVILSLVLMGLFGSFTFPNRYDYRAGFWGVMGHQCLGIIPVSYENII